MRSHTPHIGLFHESKMSYLAKPHLGGGGWDKISFKGQLKFILKTWLKAFSFVLTNRYRITEEFRYFSDTLFANFPNKLGITVK